MAIWQLRLILIPEIALLREFRVLPLSIPMELAETSRWWSDDQPEVGLIERQIDLILPETGSWSASMRIWGSQDSNDAYVCYSDESKLLIEEIAFRIDARATSFELVRCVCSFAKRAGCVLMTPEYDILVPDERLVNAAISSSIAGKYARDPVSALENLDESKKEQLRLLAKLAQRSQRQK